ncbi:CBS domain-containing protein [Thermoactinospora rubra]|uniref:CBS domain-containing protein n=1 Tax=Thermoactinospora rubra TaxID=1088767 RepID=UPI000A10C6FA|nr:CBS domain-containing protein [Thermoactinospora rubra]
MAMQVKDVMGRVAIAVLENATFGDIVAAMRRYAVGAVSVIDVERRPVGIVSEDDLLLKEADPVRHATSLFEGRKRREEHHKAAGVTAAQLMTSPALTVTPDTPLRDAARLMHERRVKQLPVIDAAGRIVGTLHQADVLRIFTRPAEELEADIRDAVPIPGTVEIKIDHGVVTLTGTLPRRSQAIQLIELARQVEGVIDVVSELAVERDDTIVLPPMF